MTETLKTRPEEEAPASSAPPILRLDQGNLAEALDRLGDPAALAAGLVNVIGLEGVAARFGTRWSFRRDLVHEHVERLMHRHLGEAGVFQRIGEMHYVVVQSGRSRLHAQALCLRCLREILNHFIGEVRLPDMRLHEVTRVDGNEIIGQKVELSAAALSEPATFADPETPEPERSPADPRAFVAQRTFAVSDDLEASRSFAPRGQNRTPASPLPAVAKWSPFVASNGQTVRVSCALEPVIKLDDSSRIGFRLARRVLYPDRVLDGQALRDLSRADIARVDYATIARGLERLQTEKKGEDPASLIVPVSFATLSNQRTREMLVGLLEQARAEVRLGLVCEICEIEGVPASALLTAVSMIRPFCVRVLAFASDARPAALRSLKGMGLAGVSMDCPPGLGDAEFLNWAREMSRAARTVAGPLFLYRVQPVERSVLAALAGASHASLQGATETRLGTA